jgi:hypothetical protein
VGSVQIVSIVLCLSKNKIEESQQKRTRLDQYKIRGPWQSHRRFTKMRLKISTVYTTERAFEIPAGLLSKIKMWSISW